VSAKDPHKNLMTLDVRKISRA